MAALCLPSTPQGGTRWNWTRIFLSKISGFLWDKGPKGGFRVDYAKKYERKMFIFYAVFFFGSVWLCYLRQPMAAVWNKTRNPKPGGRDVITKSRLVVTRYTCESPLLLGGFTRLDFVRLTYTVICHAWHWVIITFCHLWPVCTEQSERNVQVPLLCSGHREELLEVAWPKNLGRDSHQPWKTTKLHWNCALWDSQQINQNIESWRDMDVFLMLPSCIGLSADRSSKCWGGDVGWAGFFLSNDIQRHISQSFGLSIPVDHRFFELEVGWCLRFREV